MPNAAPVAVNDGPYNVHQGQSLMVNAANGVLTNDTDGDSDPLDAYLVSDVSHGTLTLYSDGSFDYYPEMGYVGSDSFTYYASDMTDNSNTATLSINVTNTAPVASNDSYSVHQGGYLNVSAANGVLANDTDGDSDPLTPTVVAEPSHGMLSLYSDGSFSYQPDMGYAGADSFTYKANDGAADSATVTVSLTVTNTAPVAQNDAYYMHENGYLSRNAALGVLANDSDADSDALSANIVAYASHGSVNLYSDGSFDYQPDMDWTGTDSFTYYANDGAENTSTVTVSIYVGNEAPTLMGQDFYVAVNEPLVDVPVLALASDAEGDHLTFTPGTGPWRGQLTESAGVWTYTPATDWTGTDTINGVATDGDANSSTAYFHFYVTSTFEEDYVAVSQGDLHTVAGVTVSIEQIWFAAPDHVLAFSANGLPSGLNIDEETGVISGTIAYSAASSEPYAVTITAMDNAGGAYADADFDWTVDAPEVQVFVGDQENVVGAEVEISLGAWSTDGRALVFSVTGLPDGLSIDAETGTITGTIDSEADGNSPYSVTVTAANETADVSQNVTFTWSVGLLVLLNPRDQQNVVTEEVGLEVAAPYAGTGTLTFSASGLPDGLSISATTGVISGTIDANAGADDPYEVTIEATDGTLVAAKTFLWDVRKLFVTNPETQESDEGDNIGFQISVRKIPGHTMSFSATGLPDGVGIDSGTGAVSGTISEGESQNGPFTGTITATDTDANVTVTQTFRWVVSALVTGAISPFPDSTSKTGSNAEFFCQVGGPAEASAAINTALRATETLQRYREITVGARAWDAAFPRAMNTNGTPEYNVTLEIRHYAQPWPLVPFWIWSTTTTTVQFRRIGDTVQAHVPILDADGNIIASRWINVPNGN